MKLSVFGDPVEANADFTARYFDITVHGHSNIPFPTRLRASCTLRDVWSEFIARPLWSMFADNEAC